MQDVSDPKTQAELLKLAEKVLSGTPDAARAEPFSWTVLFWVAFIVIAILLMSFAFNRYLIKYLTEFIKGLMDDQIETHQKCHNNQICQLKLVAEVVAEQKASNERVVDSNEKVAEVLATTLSRLGHP